MKLKQIKVKNYRLLKDFSIDLGDDLSLVVGKNNCGKTSLLSVLGKFLHSRAFAFDDFNVDFRNHLKTIVEADRIAEESYKPIGIAMQLIIEYGRDDDLSRVGKLMMDLDPKNTNIILLLEYVLTLDKLKKLREDFSTFSNVQQGKKEKTPTRDLLDFLKDKHASYFEIFRKTLAPETMDNTRFVNVEKADIDAVINYQFIKADRDVSNKERDTSLSALSSEIYKKIEANEQQTEAIGNFKDQLRTTDAVLGGLYGGIFNGVISNVKKFGGIKPDDTIIEVASTLQHKELLKSNTTVTYKHDSHSLPESYNGLGYMNLISMIFQIEIVLNEFREKPADINLLFIEEPEAHTHPQMQYIFIKNIKSLLKDGVKKGALQYIVSTHSSHIVAEGVFDDIKYLKREKNSVSAKNLKDLEEEYGKDGGAQNYKFLKQYLTLHRAELFFADKAIFIEGDTERILLPAIMKKIDLENPENPLLSQNISIVEVGNYAKVFEKFIDFVGIKSLIITDIDSASKDGTKKEVSVASLTTNASLKFFYGSDGNLNDFKDKTIVEMVLKKVLAEGAEKKEWTNMEDGHLLCVYQTNEKNSNGIDYHARSFEDAFFHLNRQFIIDHKTNFGSLKIISKFDSEENDAYTLAKECIEKKPPFAIEILLNSEDDFSNWEIPAYIKQGLLWLKTD